MTSTIRSITLTFPFPDMSRASIHGNGSRQAKAKQIKEVRAIARHASLDQGDGFVRLEVANIRYWIFMPNKIKRDAANMVQACKPIIDGIVDAKILAGDSWDVLKIAGVHVEVDRVNPRVEIQLWQQ